MNEGECLSFMTSYVQLMNTPTRSLSRCSIPPLFFTYAHSRASCEAVLHLVHAVFYPSYRKSVSLRRSVKQVGRWHRGPAAIASIAATSRSCTATPTDTLTLAQALLQHWSQTSSKSFQITPQIIKTSPSPQVGATISIHFHRIHLHQWSIFQSSQHEAVIGQRVESCEAFPAGLPQRGPETAPARPSRLAILQGCKDGGEGRTTRITGEVVEPTAVGIHFSLWYQLGRLETLKETPLWSMNGAVWGSNSGTVRTMHNIIHPNKLVNCKTTCNQYPPSSLWELPLELTAKMHIALGQPSTPAIWGWNGAIPWFMQSLRQGKYQCQYPKMLLLRQYITGVLSAELRQCAGKPLRTHLIKLLGYSHNVCFP